MIRKFWKFIPAVLACSVFGLASAQTAAPPAKASAAAPAPAAAADAKKKADADAAKAAEAQAQAKAEDRAVANYKKNKGGGMMEAKK